MCFRVVPEPTTVQIAEQSVNGRPMQNIENENNKATSGYLEVLIRVNAVVKTTRLALLFNDFVRNASQFTHLNTIATPPSFSITKTPYRTLKSRYNAGTISDPDGFTYVGDPYWFELPTMRKRSPPPAHKVANQTFRFIMG